MVKTRRRCNYKAVSFSNLSEYAFNQTQSKKEDAMSEVSLKKIQNRNLWCMKNNCFAPKTLHQLRKILKKKIGSSFIVIVFEQL